MTSIWALMNRSRMNRFLYVFLALFSLIFLIQGSVAFRHYNSDFIFKVELLFVFLYFLTNKTFPYQTLKNSKLLTGIIIVWTSFLVGQHLVRFGGQSHSNITFFFSLFHVFFALFAVSVFQEMVEYERREFRQNRRLSRVSGSIVFVLLCALTLSIALIGVGDFRQKADIVFRHQVLFVLACVFISNTIPSISYYLRKHLVVTLIISCWVLAVTISFMLAPHERALVYERYDQTIMHCVFFIFAYEFLRRLIFDKQYLVLMIPFSAVLIVMFFIYSWYQLEPGLEPHWFTNSPLNSHIRQVGYIAVASTCISFVFTMHPDKVSWQTLTCYFMLVVASALLFWTGGRAAIGSTLFIFVLAALCFSLLYDLHWKRIVLTFIAMSVGLIFAEQLKIFEWNGILSQVSRTIEATSFNAVSTGRLGLWASSIESLESHWIFGLGPQGYYLMPNRIWGTQPHSLIIQFLVEWGVVGTVLFLSLLSLIVKNILSFVKCSTQPPSVVFLSAVAMFGGLTIHGLVSGTYFHAKASYFIALSIAVLLSEISIQKNEIKI